MYKLPLILLLFFTAFPTFVKCQKSPNNQDKILDLAIRIGAGVTWLANNNLNNSLKKENLPTALDGTSFSMNSDIYLSSLHPGTRFIADIGAGLSRQKKNSNHISLDALAAYNDYNIYYVAWQHKRQYFYPGLGWGWMTYNYNFVNNADAPGSYPQALQDFNGERQIKSGFLSYLNLVANYDWALDPSENFLLSFKASYHLGLNQKDLQLSNGNELTQSPE